MIFKDVTNKSIKRCFRFIGIILFVQIIFGESIKFLNTTTNRRGKYVISEEPLKWWQTGVIYQVYPRSFKDSDADGIGDLRGIEEKAEYFKELGISAVWLSPIYKSPMSDFGYDVSDYRTIASEYGTIDDFLSLASKLHSLGIKLMLDFVPNHTSDEHEWFPKSIKRIEPYTDYYIWKDPKGWTNDREPIPPNNWISNFTGSAWQYNKERKQFYLHTFGVKQPDLNYRNKRVQQEMTDVLKFWMDKNVDGFRVDAVQFLVEHEDFKDEPIRADYDKDAESSEPIYNSLDHIYTIDQPETYEIVKLFHKTIEEYKAGSNSRIMVTEAYTSLHKTLEYYVGKDGVGIDMPLNFLFIRLLDARSSAEKFAEIIHGWMDNMPQGKWANWVSGNHDNPRASKRFGDDLVDGINMLVLLLPGTAFTYYGEEIGMQNTYTRWDETVDPQGLNVGPQLYDRFSRDPSRTPFQWDSSISAGFSKSHKTWLPVNPNYWYLNIENQKQTSKSHYNVYKRLVHLRNTNPTIQRGSFITRALFAHTLLLIRELEGHLPFAVIINLDSKEVVIDLETIHELPSTMYVHTSSINSQHDIGDALGVFRMRPKSSLLLTSNKAYISKSEKITSSETSSSSVPPLLATLTLSFPAILLTFLYA